MVTATRTTSLTPAVFSLPVADGLGRSLTFQYNGTGQLTNVTDGTRSIGFVQQGTLLAQMSDALGNTTTYSYDGANTNTGLLTAATQPNGNTTFRQTYNAAGQVIVQVEAGVPPGTNTYTYNNDSTAITDPFGNQSIQSNNASGELVTLTDEAGKASNFAYNTAGQRNSTIDRLAHTTLMGYHAPSGKLAATTNADGTCTTIAYAARVSSGITFYDPSQISYPRWLH